MRVPNVAPDTRLNTAGSATDRTIPNTAPDIARDATHTDASVSPSRKWRWSANVLLIGTSQSGKSTFINRDPFIYEYDIPMTDYILVDSQDKTNVEVPDDEGDIFNLGFWKRKDTILQQRDGLADVARIRLIDTPGLDDSDEARNATNIQKVLRLLNDMSTAQDLEHRHISAVVFIIKSAIAFHASLQQWYHYYQRCMPNLFGSVAVVNTNMRIRDWKAEYSRKAASLVGQGSTELSSRNSKIKERRQAWEQIFNSNPTHFFIDSKPRSAFEDYMSANTVHSILIYLRSQGRLPIENIRLAKFNSMLAIDDKLVSGLHQVCENWEKERISLVHSLSTVQQSLALHEKNKLDLEIEIDERENRLQHLDTDVEYDLRTYGPLDNISMGDRIWKVVTFSGHEGNHSVTEDVYPYEVSAPDTNSTRWKSRTMVNPSSKTWTGEWVSNWTKMPNYSIRTYTRNRIQHADEISKLKREILEKEDKLIKTKDVIAKQKDPLSKSSTTIEENPRISQLAQWIARGEKHARHLKEENVSLQEGFTPSAIKRYAKTINQVGSSDILDYIVDTEPDLRLAVEFAIAQLT